MIRCISLIAAAALCSACAHQPAPPPGTAHSLHTTGPNPDAPAAVNQFGQLVGHWSCGGANRAPDGSWTPNATPAHWDWYWILDGFGVQDVWQPGTTAPGSPLRVGTNVRVYDPKTQQWNIVWTTAAQAVWENITARWQDDRMVMHMDRAKGRVFPAHAARITFYNIGDTHFDWTYEFAPSGTAVDAKGWTLTSKLDCNKTRPGTS